MESNQSTQNTTNTRPSATGQHSRTATDNYKGRGDGQERPYRPRGEYRGNNRGRQYQDGEEAPFRRGRGGRGRGGYQNNDNANENGVQVESSDAVYKDRPRYQQNEDGTPYRGRGGRGGRGRGRGGISNYENARPARRTEDLNSDEEIVECTEEQMDFINEWKAYNRKNIKVLAVSDRLDKFSVS